MTTQIEKPVSHERKHEDMSEAEYDGIKVIQDFMVSAEIGESPININLTKTIPISLPPLEWFHHDLPPKKMKCTNTGHTLIMSAKWHQERPYVTGGPLFGNYVFSQLHFHWGKNDMEGSEHTVDGSAQPLEMHVVLFKSCYLTQEAALKKKDGIVVIVYFFKLQAGQNVSMELLTDAIPYIQMPHSSARLDPLPLSFLTVPFEKDYFMYWGSVTTSDCIHVLLWLISREPIGISSEQLEVFRGLLNIEEEPLQGNFRPTQDDDGIKRTIFHANPSYSLYSTLLPVRRAMENSVRKNETQMKVEKDEEFVSTPMFRMEPTHKSPFDDKKEAACNKYTISTSIKVDPNMLEKIKGAKTKVKPERKQSAKKIRSNAKMRQDGCMFDVVSINSNTCARPTSRPSNVVPLARNESTSRKEKIGSKPSLIPRPVH